MGKASFKVLVVGEARPWQRVQENIPADPGFQFIYLPIQKAMDSGPPAADLLLITPQANRIPAVISLYRDWSLSIPAAVVADNLPAHTVVSLVRSGFSEVFDLSSDMEILREWLLNYYEESLTKRESSRKNSIIGATEIHGVSPGIQEVRNLAKQAASYSDMTVLVQGETGTGKEMVARMIHENSPRHKGPFIEINCSAIPETLMEAEMLGNEKGAFTDARRVRKGFFELAAGGTLFLDEIGVMSPAMQNKILKIVEEKTFRRIGGETQISVDVKIIAGTNIDLNKAVERGDFRPDLLYRLKVFTIMIPPLRDRKDDLTMLAKHFMNKVAEQYQLNISGFHPSTENFLLTYSWPGNVRELKHTVERACVLAGRGRILPTHLPEDIQSLDISVLKPDININGDDDLVVPLPATGLTLNEIERLVVRAVLKRCKGNQSEAARYLGISRTRLARKLTDLKD